MKTIMTATLHPTNTTTIDGTPCEYDWTESNECEYGVEWEGNIEAYLDNILEEPFKVMETYPTIHNEPAGAIVVGNEDGMPTAIFWAEDAEDTEDFEIYEDCDTIEIRPAIAPEENAEVEIDYYDGPTIAIDEAIAVLYHDCKIRKEEILI